MTQSTKATGMHLSNGGCIRRRGVHACMGAMLARMPADHPQGDSACVACNRGGDRVAGGCFAVRAAARRMFSWPAGCPAGSMRLIAGLIASPHVVKMTGVANEFGILMRGSRPRHQKPSHSVI
eukprot:363725-Chlamydomonas_euryale.AAC.14